MRILNIKKGDIRTTVGEDMFLAMYKPQGWVEVGANDKEVVEVEAVAVEEIKELDNKKPVEQLQAEVKNVSAMNKKKRTNNKFNDNLIKQ